MAEVNQERRKVFEIQIESLRAVGQSIVGALGNMNLLEATLKPSSELDQLARANQACIQELLHQFHSGFILSHPSSFSMKHFFCQTIFAFIHDSIPDFLPISSTRAKLGVSAFPLGRKQLVNRLHASNYFITPDGSGLSP